jgi:hypothetical protein
VERASLITLFTGKENTMKTTTIIAIFLIALGVIALGYQGITYTTSEKVVDIGPLPSVPSRI